MQVASGERVYAYEVDGKGSVVAVAVAHLRHDRPLLLLVHRCSGALIWDIRWVAEWDCALARGPPLLLLLLLGLRIRHRLRVAAAVRAAHL